MLKWCNKCVLSDGRPNIIIHEDGICNACKNHEKKNKINWTLGKKKLKIIFNKLKKKKSNYDCIIPVSGGKDSTWQTLVCLENKLKPLAITYKSPGRNSIGEANLKNLISLGVDHIDFTLNPKIEKYFILKSLKNKGSPAIPMHFLIYNLPKTFAKIYNIPLIVWGENPAKEYGFLNKKDLLLKEKYWWKKHGAVSGTELNFWKDNILNDKNLISIKSNENDKVRSIFLSDFINWDPVKIKKYSEKKGFKYLNKAKTGIYNFADIDCDFISIHHYLKWYKFGLTRVFDNLSLEIRNSRISKKKALVILRKSLMRLRPNKDIIKFCEYIGISVKQFNRICEKFRNRKIWKKDKNIWKIDNFIFDDFNWK